MTLLFPCPHVFLQNFKTCVLTLIIPPLIDQLCSSRFCSSVQTVSNHVKQHGSMHVLLPCFAHLVFSVFRIIRLGITCHFWWFWKKDLNFKPVRDVDYIKPLRKFILWVVVVCFIIRLYWVYSHNEKEAAADVFSRVMAYWKRKWRAVGLGSIQRL